MDLLPIQASSVPCERVFSSSKETMSARRSRIGPDLMEALQMLKYSIKQSGGLNFTDGYAWDDELAEMEHLAVESLPDDSIVIESLAN